MALKGINPIERHFDKAIAVLFGLALLAVIIWQFLGDPLVNVGPSAVRIPDAYPKIADAAKQTQLRMEQQNVEKPSGTDPSAEQIARFEKLLRGPVAPAPELAVALDQPPPPIGGSTLSVGGITPRIATLDVPAPMHPLAASYLGTIDPAEAQADHGVESILPKSEPYDLASVTVEALFDGAALKERLLADPDGAGPAVAIPRNWWENSVQILGVELVRQALVADNPASAGPVWGPEEVVAPMPGRQPLPTPLDRVNGVVALLDDVRSATNTPAPVRRPDYYRIRFGEKWTPPSEREAAAALGEVDIARLKAERSKALEELKRIEDRIAGFRSAPPPTPPPGGGRPPGGPPPPRPGTPPAATAGQRKQHEKQRDDKKAQVAQLEARLRELGEVIPGDAPNPDAAARVKAPTETALFDSATTRIWAHDVHVTRGQTYRYRVVALLSNPFYGHGAAVLPDQAILAKEPITRSQASDWTEPVVVEADSFWFVTGASGGDDAVSRAQSAKAEVFQFKWGYWRRGSVQLEPGDAVVAEIRVPDMSRVAAGPADEHLPDERAGLPPPRPDSGGKKGLPGPADAIPITSTPFSSQFVLLGVGAIPTAGEPSERVYFRDLDGGVFSKTPREERELAVYKRVSRSFDRGERELKPEREPRPPTGPKPPSPGGDKNRPREN